ncbi:MAG: DUF4919 domain-containing protein [Reichenbachiella sp.]|uniref:DUF4919 domain-containing protein n=1 Tax=Reichenbachiella sp. TaxID=2184521 RepID=UPI003266AEE4
MLKQLTTLLVFTLFANSLKAQDYSEVLSQANDYYENSQYREALSLYSKVVESDSADAELFKLRGNCYYQLNHIENAISDYKRAIRMDSTFADGYYNLANVFDEQDVLDSAVLNFRIYNRLQKDDPEGYVRLANCFQKQGRSDSVTQMYEYAFTLDSSNLMTIHYLSWNYFYIEDYERARTIAIKAENIDSLDINFALLHGMCSLELGNFQEAVDQSVQALQIDSLNFDAFTLGLEAKILAETDLKLIEKDENKAYKFKDYTSKNLNLLLDKNNLIPYDSLFDRMKNTEILSRDDYLRFYLAQSQQSTYSPYFQMSDPKIAEHFNNQEFMELAKYTENVLQATPLKLNDIYKVSVANYMTRNMDDFRRLYSIYYGLMESIIATGDGTKYESAYIVVSTADEYSLLNYFGLRSAGQSLQHSDGHSYDILTAFDQDSEESEVYFNIDLPFGRLDSSFSGSSKDKKKGKKKNRKGKK